MECVQRFGSSEQQNGPRPCWRVLEDETTESLRSNKSQTAKCNHFEVSMLALGLFARNDTSLTGLPNKTLGRRKEKKKHYPLSFPCPWEA